MALGQKESHENFFKTKKKLWKIIVKTSRPCLVKRFVTFQPLRGLLSHVDWLLNTSEFTSSPVAPSSPHKFAGCYGTLSKIWFFFPKCLFSTKEMKKAQLYQHLKPSSSFEIIENTQSQRHMTKQCTLQMPSCNWPCSENLISIHFWSRSKRKILHPSLGWEKEEGKAHPVGFLTSSDVCVSSKTWFLSAV